jgi:sulfate/thiosulfate transport system substrate-binding protein
MRVNRLLVGVVLTNAAMWMATLAGCQAKPEQKGDKPSKSTAESKAPVEILNVSYDPTRELYREFDAAFTTYWADKTGQTVKVKPSHAGSGSQARDVIAGKPADVVTLALAYDVDAIRRKAGLLADGWQKRLPYNSAPYTSTIVFLVRKGNPKQIKDWGDLIKADVGVITPNPKTSGGARWNYLAAWGYVLKRELGDFGKLNDPKHADAVAKAQQKAREFVKQLFEHVLVLDSGARGSTTTFVQRGMGDVLLAWENEAFLSIKELGADKLEIVVPSISILAEPSVAVVDKNVDKHGTREVAEAYLKHLYSPEGQTIAAKNYYRPRETKSVPAELLNNFPKVELFTIDDVFGGWDKVQPEHFGDGGVFDRIYKPSK